MKRIEAFVDFGSSLVRVAIVALSENRAQILGMGAAAHEGMRRGDVADIWQLSAALRNAAELAERDAGLKIHRIILAIGGAMLGEELCGQIRLPERIVRSEDITRVIQEARGKAQQKGHLLHALLRNFRVDEHRGILHPRGMTADELGVTLYEIRLPKGRSAQWKKVAKMAGFEIEQWLSSVVCASEDVLTLAEKNGACLIDLGAQNSDFAFWQRGTVRAVGSIPLGGENVSSDLSHVFKISREGAESLKRMCHLHEDDEKLPTLEIPGLGAGWRRFERREVKKIICDRYSEIFSLLLRAIRESAPGVALESFVLTGGASRIPGVAQLFTTLAEFPVRVAAPIFPEPSSFIDPEQTQGSATLFGMVAFLSHPPQDGVCFGEEKLSIISRLKNFFRD